MKKLIILSLIIISFLLSYSLTTKIFNTAVYAQTTIDTLSFFLIDDEDVELTDVNNQNEISQRTIGSAKFVTKWRMPNQHEYYTWDDDYIFLRYDHTCCGDNPIDYQGTDSYEFTEFPGKGGRWLKRQMAVGESFIVNKPGSLTWYKADCSNYATVDLKYKNTLEAYYPNYNLGGNLGTDEVIVLRSDSIPPDENRTEKFFFSKKWGWIRWQAYVNGALTGEAIWNKKSLISGVHPVPKCANFPYPYVTPTPCPPLGSPTNLQVSCLPTTAQLNWSAATNASYYSVRIDDKIDSWNNSCSPPDSCVNTPNTWYHFPFTPNHTYRWWIHSRNSCEDWGDTISGPDVTCLSSSQYTCPLHPTDMTGVMQWNDGWPFSFYGRQTHYDNAYKVVDVNGYFGSPVYAPAAGEVIDLYGGDDYVNGGMTIAIRGDDGNFYELNHVINPKVAINQRVSADQVIGSLVSYESAINDGRLCDTAQEFTTTSCYKVHVHFAAYSGSYQNPSIGLTLPFLSTYCGIERPADDTTPEFPELPTLNCAKITGNPNIDRCFMRNPFSSFGWNKITLTSNEVQNSVGHLFASQKCPVVSRKENGRWRVFSTNSDPLPISLPLGTASYLKCLRS